jgi:hypothetical protein
VTAIVNLDDESWCACRGPGNAGSGSACAARRRFRLLALGEWPKAPNRAAARYLRLPGRHNAANALAALAPAALWLPAR